MSQSSSHTSMHFDQTWVGLKVHIGTPDGATSEWTLGRKIYERVRRFERHGKEARAVFQSTDADDVRCIIKVRMLLNETHERSFQFSASNSSEIEALRKLSENECQSAPRFLGSMDCVQTEQDPRPGAPTSFIAMEELPGKVYDFTEFWRGTTLWERQQKRAAFKKAYYDCFQCGYWNLDAGLRNLIFDDTHAKCYIIDWETAIPVFPGLLQWTDRMYGMWELAQYNRANPEDLSSWVL